MQQAQQQKEYAKLFEQDKKGVTVPNQRAISAYLTDLVINHIDTISDTVIASTRISTPRGKKKRVINQVLVYSGNNEIGIYLNHNDEYEVIVEKINALKLYLTEQINFEGLRKIKAGWKPQ
jgi:hypothetical protein